MTDQTTTSTPQVPSRRTVIRAGLGMLGAAAAIAGIGKAEAQAPAAAAAPAPAPATKLSQASVQYQSHPNNGQLCSICANFIAPHSCQIVDGTINPIGWCVAFAPKA